MSEIERLEQNLGMVLGDMGYGAQVPDPAQARPWAPALRRKIQHLTDHSQQYHLSPAVKTMVGAWGRLVEKYEDVCAEVQRMKQTSTVYYTVAFQDIPTGTKSSVATSRVPYSGTAAMLRGILLNSQTTPIGGFGDLEMAGIPFTDPSRNAGVVSYGDAAGTAGVPVNRWMDPTPFLHDETAPFGGRAVQFWVDWVLDPSAQILTSWVNPDAVNTISVAVNYLFTSTPCAGMNYQLGAGGLWHKSMHPDIGRVMNQMATSVFGLGTGGLPTGFSTAMNTSMNVQRSNQTLNMSNLLR